jgi:hypothetical protein
VPIAKAPMLLVLNSTDVKKEKEILETIEKHAKYYKVKSRSITKSKEDMVVELRIKDGSALVQEISGYDYITSVSLLSHDGETTF